MVPHGVPPSKFCSRKKLFMSMVLITFGVFIENMAKSKLFLTKLHEFDGFWVNSGIFGRIFRDFWSLVGVPPCYHSLPLPTQRK